MIVRSCPSTWPRGITRSREKGSPKTLVLSPSSSLQFSSPSILDSSRPTCFLPFPLIVHLVFGVLFNATRRHSCQGIPRRIIIPQFRRHAAHRRLFFAANSAGVPDRSGISRRRRRRFARCLKRPLVGFLLKVELALNRDI